MTSGEFAHFPVDEIWVDRAKRQRRELTEIPELLADMTLNGQINPILIKRDGELIAGERRWTAARLGGWTRIAVQFAEDLESAVLQRIELAENIKRAQLPWPDECKAVALYHSLMVQANPAWTQEDTATDLGMTRNAVGQKIAVAKEIEAGNQRVIDAPRFSVARGVTSRVNERRQADGVAAALKASAPAIKSLLPPKQEKVVPLINADFHVWAAEYAGPKFSFIHCDFPYGINADEHDQSQAASHGGYADTFETYTELLDTLESAMGNVVAESAHLLFWFSMDHYDFTRQRLVSMGWAVQHVPLIWYKNDNTGILPDYRRGPRRSYETAFLASRGDRLLTAKGAVSNVCPWPGKDKEIHMSEKPVGMLKHFMGMVVDELSTVLDPTCGSGNSLKAATALGAKSVLGIEAVEEFYTRAKEAYYGNAD